MPIYTISDTIVKGIECKHHVSRVLHPFTDVDRAYKVAVDKKGLVMDRYAKIGKTCGIFSTWLRLMAKDPSSFEAVVIKKAVEDISNGEELFLCVCASTCGPKKLIVYSHQDWNYFTYAEGTSIEYDGEMIHVLDLDEAGKELREDVSLTINKSVVAMDGSKIRNADIRGALDESG